MDEVKFLTRAFLFNLLFILGGGELVPNKRDILQVWSLVHQLCFRQWKKNINFTEQQANLSLRS